MMPFWQLAPPGNWSRMIKGMRTTVRFRAGPVMMKLFAPDLAGAGRFVCGSIRFLEFIYAFSERCTIVDRRHVWCLRFEVSSVSGWVSWFVSLARKSLSASKQSCLPERNKFN